MNNLNMENFLQDNFLGGQIKIVQPKDGYRAGSDTVFLAASIPLYNNQTILEIGCGAGTASLCLAARAKLFHPKETIQLTGIDIQEDLIELAQHNAKHNALAVNFQQDDLRQSHLVSQAYDHVFANPPYFTDHAPSAHIPRATARNEMEGNLKDWIAYCIKMVKPRGYISIIYPTDRLGELLHLCKPALGELRLFPLWPRPHTPAKRFILRGRKDVKSPDRLLSGLILHNEAGEYTSAARKILWDGMDLIF